MNHDFKFENGNVSFIEVDANNQEHEFKPGFDVKVSVGSANAKTPIKAKNKTFFSVIGEFFKKIVRAIISIFTRN